MISESQERMCAIVRPDRWDDVREVAERWGLPVAIIGRVTDDGDITVVRGENEIARSPRRRPDERRDRPSAPRARPRRTARAAPAPGVPLDPSDRLPERGMDPGAVLLALLGSPNLASRRAVFEQYDSTVGADTVVGQATAPRSSAIKGTTKALVASTDGNQAVGALDPYAGAAMSVAEATRNVSHHRRAAAGRHELPELRRPDAAGGVLAAQRGASAASATRAGRSGCRSPAATSRSTTSRPPARSRRRPRSASSACSTTSRRGRPGVRRRRRCRSLLVGEPTPGLAGSAYAALAGTAAEDGLPVARPRARSGAAARSCGRRSSRGLVAQRAGRRRRRAGGRARRDARCGAGVAPRSASPSRCRRPSSCSARARRGSS